MFQVLYAGSETFLPEKKAPIVLEKSIAVLPFVNMSNDEEQEYFSDGITEEIINMLAQVPRLTVMGRTSSFAFKGKNMDLKLIGEALNVAYLLEGSVRRSGNTLRITAQLINVANGSHLYSEKFDRELKDIFDIQDEISEKILNAVKIKLLGEEKDAFLKKNTDNLEAHELYLKGIFHINKFTPEGFIKAIEYLDAAISLDTNYALAYAQLSFCYTNLLDFNWLASEDSLPKARIAARKSLELDDKIFESHLNVGRILLHQDWNVRDAMAAYKKALAINPNSAETYVQLAMCLAQYDRCEEAMEYARIAENLDPISVLNLFYVGTIPFLCNNPQALLAIGKKLTELEPNFFSGYVWAGMGYGGLERYDEAIAELEISVKQNPGTWTLSLLGTVHGYSGNTSKAREVIDKIKAEEGYERFANTNLGNVYYAIGELDSAFEYYHRALEYHEGQLLYVKYTNRLYGHPMEDPKAAKMFEKMNIIL
jgi:serine/threonine-protein kinase